MCSVAAATGAHVEVVQAHGCDAQPLDPRRPEDKLTLQSAVWADQPERFAALEAALAVAAELRRESTSRS